MKILILGLNFTPEPIGVGRYTGEFAAWLAGRGHEVRVVTAPPYYPAWQVAPGYEAAAFRRDLVDGVSVVRCPLWVPDEPTFLRRLVHLASFALSSFPATLWEAWRWRPDVVWTVEPALLCAPAALLAARSTGARACIHAQDLELEAALRLGLVDRPKLATRLRALYGWLLRRFDLISTLSRDMRARLAEVGVPRDRLCLFPNWVDTGAIRPLEEPSRLRLELGIGDDRPVALYAGNMGRKQGLDCLAAAIERLGDTPVHFVLCGAGPMRAELERRLGGRANVSLLPLQPAEEMNDLLNLADLHLLPQQAGASNFALPSKLGPMLASGRPVVAQCDDHSQVRDAAGFGGKVVPPGDATALADAIRDLALDPERRRQLGQAARVFAAVHLERDRIIARYERTLAAIGEGEARLAPGTRSRAAG